MEGEQPIKEGFLHKAHPKESFLSVTVSTRIKYLSKIQILILYAQVQVH